MHKTQDIQQQRQFLPMGNYLFLVFRPPTFNFNLLNYRIYVQKKKKNNEQVGVALLDGHKRRVSQEEEC